MSFFRPLFRDVAIYGSGDVILKAIAIFTMPIYTRMFSPEDYGVWSYILSTVGLFSSVVLLGLDQAYALFFFEAKTREERQRLTSTLLGFVVLWCGGIALLCLPFTGLFSRWSFGTGQHRLAVVLALLAMPVSMVTRLCAQALRNQFRARAFTLLNVLTVALSVGLSLWWVLGWHSGILGLFWGPLVAMSLLLPVRLWTIRSLLLPVFSIRVLRSMLAYGLPLVPAFMAIWVYSSSDRVIMGKLASLEDVGLYAVANSLNSLLVFVGSAFGQAWSPHAVKLYTSDPDQASRLFGQVLTYLLIGFGVLCVGLTVFAREALAILSTPQYYDAAHVAGPLALAALANVSAQVTMCSISLKKKTGYISLFTWISAAVSFLLNLWLVPRWGMVAAGWVSALCAIGVTLAYARISQRLWPIVYELRKVLVVSLLTLLFVVGARWLPATFSAQVLAVKTAFAMSFVGLLVLCGVLDPRRLLRARPAAS